jgi:hypothetical protein
MDWFDESNEIKDNMAKKEQEEDTLDKLNEIDNVAPKK